MIRRVVALFGYTGTAALSIDRLLSLYHLETAVAAAAYTDQGSELSPTVMNEVAVAIHRAGLEHLSEKDGKLRVFVTRGLSAMSGGSCLLGTGAAIGVPRTFMCDNPNHPLLSSLKVRGLTSESDESGRVPADLHRIRELLVRTPDSRGFAITHELGHIVREDGLLTVALAGVAGVGTTKAVLRGMSRGRPGPTITGLIGVGMLLVSSRWAQEISADAFAVRCGYTEGAREFFRQRSELNQILRRQRLESAKKTKQSVLGRIGSVFDASVAQRLPPGDFAFLPELLTHPPVSLRQWCIGLSSHVSTDTRVK